MPETPPSRETGPPAGRPGDPGPAAPDRSPSDNDTDARLDLDPLLAILRKLHDPESGCPWDSRLELEDLVKPLLSEADELVEALRSGETALIREEAGDLLWNVLTVLEIARKRGRFAPQEAADAVAKKMVERHPHVFAGAHAATADEASRLYHAAKAREKETARAAGSTPSTGA